MCILSGTRPGRPTHRSLTDGLWDLTERCWDHDPQRRPDISDVTSRLRTTFTFRDGGHKMPGATTLGSLKRELSPGEFPPFLSIGCQYLVRSEASYYHPPRPTPAFCGLERLSMFGKLSHVPRSARSKDIACDFESEEYEKSVDTGLESINGPNRAGRKSRWFSRYEPHPMRNHYESPSNSPGKRGMAL